MLNALVTNNILKLNAVCNRFQNKIKIEEKICENLQ